MKISGLITGVGLTIIALITGLLELKRSGNIIHAGKEPTPLKTVKKEPWKEIEDVAKKNTGHGLIFIGDQICWPGYI